MDLKPGQLLGSYRIEERLVSGGNAKVYRALQPSTNREVAIKVLPAMSADPAAVARFEREMRVVAERRSEFRTGPASALDSWHEVTLQIDDANARVLLTLDGDPVGELPFAAHGPGTWYLLLSGWSADGQAVEGDIDNVRVARGSR